MKFWGNIWLIHLFISDHNYYRINQYFSRTSTAHIVANWKIKTKKMTKSKLVLGFFIVALVLLLCIQGSHCGKLSRSLTKRSSAKRPSVFQVRPGSSKFFAVKERVSSFLAMQKMEMEMIQGTIFLVRGSVHKFKISALRNNVQVTCWARVDIRSSGTVAVLNCWWKRQKLLWHSNAAHQSDSKRLIRVKLN